MTQRDHGSGGMGMHKHAKSGKPPPSETSKRATCDAANEATRKLERKQRWYANMDDLMRGER